MEQEVKIKSEKVEDFLWVKISDYRLYTCIVMGHTHLNQEIINLRINYNSLSVPSTSNMTRVISIDGHTDSWTDVLPFY